MDKKYCYWCPGQELPDTLPLGCEFFGCISRKWYPETEDPRTWESGGLCRCWPVPTASKPLVDPERLLKKLARKCKFANDGKALIGHFEMVLPFTKREVNYLRTLKGV